MYVLQYIYIFLYVFLHRTIYASHMIKYIRFRCCYCNDDPTPNHSCTARIYSHYLMSDHVQLSILDASKGGDMMFSVLSTVSMAGIMLASYYFQNSSSGDDHEKIKKISDAAGLTVKENREKQSIRIYRKVKKKNYTEYIYKIPLGLSFKQFTDNKQLYVDGLNNKSRHDFTLANLKGVNWRGDVIKQLKRILNNRIKLDKQIEMEYDGMLRFKIHDKGIEEMYKFDDGMLAKLSDWKVGIGYTLNDFITHDFDKLQMLVVAGMTRYGKTVFLKNAITTLISNNPDDVAFTLIDLKGGLAFSRFANCRQVKTVAKNSSETVRALEDIHLEMINKQHYFLKRGVEDIKEAKEKGRHFIVIDEGAEISGFEKKKDRDRSTYLIGEIARLGAGLGYRMIFATQYPTADVFPRTVKSNTSAALCFKLKNSTQSMVVLDRGGAEDLPVGLWGRAIYQTDQDRIVQTPLIDNKYIDDKIKVHIRVKKECLSEKSKRGTDSVVFETL